MTTELPKAYEPREVEPRWFAHWIEHGVFRASGDPADPRPPYVIAMPPPNVTGSLHMGHALYTIQDVLSRHERMQGHDVLWQPGIDHAGIATQTVVERQLRREGLSRHDLGREKFVERVWAWKAESGGRIADQMRALGFSADWQRSKFTMDADMSRAVVEAFVRLHEEGLIYRATRLISWCSDCRTALSDLEVENEETNGELYEFAYPVVGADPAAGATELIVATTRPETMLGDTAVAVHPDDPRYRHLHGYRLRHPFLEREIPVVTDAILVDMAFGTGAVKVTPAHDFNDFQTGKRHGLEEISILEPDGRLAALCAEFAGLTVAEGRKAVKRRLQELGLERGRKPHALMIPRCQRCATVVEPRISTQWFVKMAPLAEPALEAVRDGRTRIVPAEWVKTWEHWLGNIQDWCISRQLWWGHQIPAWHCLDCGQVTVTREPGVAACASCGGGRVERDPDVLDTWFSSALWPFSTLGWPEATPELARYYPSSDMETGYDILFFWVARMMMMGLHFLGEVPFRRVLLHGLVVDETGAKMSKVKGNTIDPLDLVHGATFEAMVRKALPGAPVAEALAKFRQAYPSVAQMGSGFPAYGADALRYTLCSFTPQAKRIALSPKRIEGYRNFCNKIYNAVRYSLPHLGGVEVGATPPRATLLVNRWILSRLGAAALESTRGIREFRLDEGSGALYHFVWDELCDWFLELTKPVLAGADEAAREETRAVLAHVIEAALRGLHPYAPFLTEELWQRAARPPGAPISVALARYPSRADGPEDPEAERDMGRLMAAIGAARAVRSEHEVHPGASVPLVLRAAEQDVRRLFEREAGAISFLVKTAGPPRVEAPSELRPRGHVLTPTRDADVLVGLSGLVEPEKEASRIRRRAEKATKDLAVLEKRLSTTSFVDRAPPEVVAEAREQRDRLERELERLREAEALVAELGA